MRPLTTVAISAPTTPPNMPSNMPMEASFRIRYSLKAEHQVHAGHRIELLERGRWFGVVRNSVADTERQLIRHLHGKRKVIMQQGIVRARFHEEFIGEDRGLRYGLREVHSGRSDGLPRGVQGRARDHGAGVVLVDGFRPKPPV